MPYCRREISHGDRVGRRAEGRSDRCLMWDLHLTRVATDPSNPSSRSAAASKAECASLLLSPTRNASTRAESAARS